MAHSELFEWQSKGFTSVPHRVVIPGLYLFRAWGGMAKKWGCYFSTQIPRSRTEADRLFSVWEWGNCCLWLTRFETFSETALYIGNVDPGVVYDPMLLSMREGVQVYIEPPLEGKVREKETWSLANDLHGRFMGNAFRLDIDDSAGHV